MYSQCLYRWFHTDFIVDCGYTYIYEEPIRNFFLFGTANYELDKDYKLDVQVQTVSDPSYFYEYDVAKIDRLETKISFNRTKRYENSELRFSNYHNFIPKKFLKIMPVLF